MGKRPADTWGEIHAREFITGAFQQYGYFPLLDEFIATSGGRRIHSANVIALKEGDSAERFRSRGREFRRGQIRQTPQQLRNPQLGGAASVHSSSSREILRAVLRPLNHSSRTRSAESCGDAGYRLAHRVPGERFDVKREPGGKSEAAQNPQVILLEAPRRLSHGPDHFRLEVPAP